MHAFWMALGIIVLVLGFLDLFLTALNYDESGFLATPLCALEWRCVRGVTRRLSRRWRPVALRQIMGLQIVLAVTTWLGCVVLGFGFIYYGLMDGANFQYDGKGVGGGMFSAMYLSAAQLSTVGTSQISPETDLLRVLTIVETLSAPLLVTLSLTFLLGVFQVVRDLRALSVNFFTADAGTGDALAILSTYFPQGQPVGLDSYLQAISGSLYSYADGLRLHHIAYYFQSGRDQFSLPYVLHMLGRTLAALQWGLPAGHSATVEPSLTRLSAQYEQFADYLHDALGWTSTTVPEVVSFEDFSAAAQHGADAVRDMWLGRFFRLNRDMARLARLDAAEDPHKSYQRYRQWLPFAYRADQMTAAVSRDLDYQPVVRGDDEQARPPTHQAVGMAAAGRSFAERALMRPWRVFLNRWVVVPDPGLTRLVTAAGATLAAAAAAATLYLLSSVAHIAAVPAAMFGGMVGMYAASMPGDATVAGRKLTTLLMALPAIGAASLGAAVLFSFAISTAAMVVVVLLGVWISGFSSRLAALGQISFMAYYFALLLHLRLSQLPAFAVAAALGASWAYLSRFVLVTERTDRVLPDGLNAFRAQLALVFDPLIDAVSAARWDPDVRKRVRTDLRQLHRCAAFLQGWLRAIDPTAIELHTRPGALRLLVFDTELAADNVMAAARDVAQAGAVVPVVVRGQLAGMLERVQTELSRLDAKDASSASASTLPGRHENPENDARPPESWPEEGRRLHGAIRELLDAVRTTRNARTAALDVPGVMPLDVTTGTNSPAPPSGPVVAQAPSSAESGTDWLRVPTRRLAIQTAVATGLALLAGAAVSPAHQYWAAIAAFLVLGGSSSTVEETAVKGLQRIVGTVVGAAIGFWVTHLTGADPRVVLPLLAVCVFAAMYTRPLSYAQMVFWITVMLALMFAFLGTSETEALQIRVLETVIGAVIALGAATLLLPARTRQKVDGDEVALLQTLDDITQTCLKGLAGSSDIRALPSRALTLDQQFRQLRTRAKPLRLASGAQRLDGIERRLTAAAALAYFARHLIKATETFAASGAPLPLAKCAQLATATRDNISALIQVLDKKLPGPVHGSDEFVLDTDPAKNLAEGSRTECEALRYLVRINQIVLTRIEDTARGAISPGREARPPAEAFATGALD